MLAWITTGMARSSILLNLPSKHQGNSDVINSIWLLVCFRCPRLTNLHIMKEFTLLIKTSSYIFICVWVTLDHWHAQWNSGQNFRWSKTKWRWLCWTTKHMTRNCSWKTLHQKKTVPRKIISYENSPRKFPLKEKSTPYNSSTENHLIKKILPGKFLFSRNFPPPLGKQENSHMHMTAYSWRKDLLK